MATFSEEEKKEVRAPLSLLGKKREKTKVYEAEVLTKGNARMPACKKKGRETKQPSRSRGRKRKRGDIGYYLFIPTKGKKKSHVVLIAGEGKAALMMVLLTHCKKRRKRRHRPGLGRGGSRM